MSNRCRGHGHGRGRSHGKNGNNSSARSVTGFNADMSRLSRDLQTDEGSGPENSSNRSANSLAYNMSTMSIGSERTRIRTTTTTSLLSSNDAIAPGSAHSCIVAPRLPPAKIQQKILVKTNIYPLELEERIIYRYDVRVEAESVCPGTGAPTKIDLCAGKQDPNRATKCMLLIGLALRRYREMREFAYAYDLASTLFTNQPLDVKEVSEISIPSNASQELLHMLGDNVTVNISIMECREYAHTFRTTDFHSSITPDLLAQDYSLRQFFEILTNQNGLRNKSHFAYGYGRMYLEKGEEIDLKRGMKLVKGVDKGVRFIGGNESTGLVPALVLDAKKTPFFDEENLMDFAAAVFNPKCADPGIPYLNPKMFQEFRHRVGPVISNLRLLRLNNKKTFVATGLSTKPVKDLRNGKIPLLDAYERLKIKLRPDLPAVVLKSPYGQTYFPFEILYVLAHQKVPCSKLRQDQTLSVIKNAAVIPKIRNKEIQRHLAALDLDGNKFNPILAAFGVRISKNPIKVEANRRVPPQIVYNSNSIVNVEADKANWTAGNNKFTTPAKIGNFCLFYDGDCDHQIMANFFEMLCKAAQKRGINFDGKIKKQVVLENLETNMKAEIENSGKKNIFFMYVDNERNAHHELKLYEARYQVVTQHVKYSTVKDKAYTLENIINKINAKNFGHNYGTIPENYAIKSWLSSGDTLVIGYDVCHPEAQSSIERRMNIPPTQPSVIGISFNAAKNPETFIGDYAFHEPRKEQVTGYILEERMFHILKLFRKMRNKLPKLIVITRDGVSEGQHKMVMMEELEAIRAGIRNYADFYKTPEYSPKIVLLIAVKRHNKRFFIEKKNGDVDNCLPGTVIDHTVTRVDATEIFMQSHKVIKGTGKIPAYTLLVNEANMKMDELQAFINALCYGHQIITSAISLPEPIFQADEWAKRGRNNFRTMYRQESQLPRKRDGKVDWDKVTQNLCYKNGTLELTRSNA